MAALILIELINKWNCKCGYNNLSGAITCTGEVSDGKGGTKLYRKDKNTA
jgi:hypothetical protein